MWRGMSAALLVASTLSSTAASAETRYRVEVFELRTGHDLYAVCTIDPSHPDRAVARAYCAGFIKGAGQLHHVLVEGPDFDALVCPPEGLTLDDVVGVYAGYALSNPDHMKETAIDSLLRAVAAEWPCDK